MAWDDRSPTDVTGVVLWWSRWPGNRLAEVHHLKSYRGRLRVFEQRGHGALIFDEPVHISHDGRHGPDPKDVAHWQALLRTIPSSNQAPNP
jgi:hypothetical protein